ncbi:hypothetical protein DFH06DRAFT_1127050 [Mycena polygramma]|nr:hypothetical protein DFH06DRAFT_1127050 [Mycena polygramma]
MPPNLGGCLHFSCTHQRHQGSPLDVSTTARPHHELWDTQQRPPLKPSALCDPSVSAMAKYIASGSGMRASASAAAPNIELVRTQDIERLITLVESIVAEAAIAPAVIDTNTQTELFVAQAQQLRNPTAQSTEFSATKSLLRTKENKSAKLLPLIKLPPLLVCERCAEKLLKLETNAAELMNTEKAAWEHTYLFADKAELLARQLEQERMERAAERHGVQRRTSAWGPGEEDTA